MYKWIVRIKRKRAELTDYVGCYLAESAVRALTLAGHDSYFHKVSTRNDVLVEAIPCPVLDGANVRTAAGLVEYAA